MNGVSSILFSGEKSASSAALRCAALDRFVAGPENQLACVAADTLAADDRRYNPLVLTGPPASGKSQLALGLASQFSRRFPDAGVIVVTAAEFSQQFARAVHDGEVALLRSTYRTSKFMVLEDLSALAGKITAQQELLHTLDALVDAGSQVVATCRPSLAHASWLLAGLRSRLSAGLEVPLSWPKLAARILLVEELAAARGTQISKTAARALAEGVTGSVPELLGALTALETSRRDTASPLLPADVQSYLDRRQPRASVGLRNLCAMTARHFGLKVAELKSPSRERSIVLARGVAMYLARQTTDKTLIEIGRFFGGRDHSTVLHGCRQIERLLHSDAQTRQAVESLQQELCDTTHLPARYRKPGRL